MVILVAYQGQQALIRQILRDKVDRVAAAHNAGGGGAQALLGGLLKGRPMPQAAVGERAGLAGVRCETIDSYQGLQSDIIILSLVRSNNNASIGFLRETNRVVVALSRARHGMYVLGNAALLAQWSESRQGRGRPGAQLWTSVLASLVGGGHIGDALPLVCQRHPSVITRVREAGDFSAVADGGCTLPCEERLECGHTCPQRCHSDGHDGMRCMKPCARLYEPCGHKCHLACLQPCGSCPQVVMRAMPGCGHEQQMSCGTDVATFRCKAPCARDPYAAMGCGHRCPLPCGKTCPPKCLQMVPKPHPRCIKGHDVITACGLPIATGMCLAECHEPLECGHPCTGSCGTCFGDNAALPPSHQPCKRKCERFLLCGHPCKAQHDCSMPCPPCERKCETLCVHSKCRKVCAEPCMPCVESCKASCRHTACTRRCGEVCDREPCSEPCPERLACGHPCIGLCGEPCPPLCAVCPKDAAYKCTLTQSTLAELRDGSPDARFVQLQDCGHVFESELLDGYMASQDITRQPAPPEGDDGAGGGAPVAIKLPWCPNCRKPVRRSVRYSRILRACHLEIEKVKEATFAGPGLRNMVGSRLAATRNPRQLEAALKALEALLEARLATNTQSVTAHVVLADVLVQRDRAANAARATELCERALRLLGREPDGSASAPAPAGEPPLRPVPTLTARQSAAEAYHALLRLGLLLAKIPGMDEAARRRLTAAVRFAGDAGLQGDARLDVEAAMRDADATERAMSERAKAAIGREGNWFRCPNGHVYVIGECGGAMERGRCPDCNAQVGGEGHRLTGGNARASNMALFDRDGGAETPWERMARINPAPDANMVARIQRGE